ncbi:MAG: restriction endonuclease subunit S [ANME-2 cluster archaeon]|nr:MAG: restriction endonuclease subunit S [ANME-2 cluster archaeon]
MKPEIKERVERIRNGEVPEGYKATKVGIIPVDWGVVPTNKVLKTVKKAVNVEPNTEYREIGIRSHGKGIFHKNLVQGNKLGDKRVFWVEEKCFIVNIVFAWEQAVAITSENERGLIASHRFPMYKPKNNLIYLDYLLAFYQSPRGKFQLNLASPGGAGRNKTLGQKEFSQSLIPLPTIDEQEKISEILSTWDQAIECQNFLIQKKYEFKKGLMQRILNRKMRIKGFEGEWVQKKLAQVAICCDKHRIPLNTESREKMKGKYPYYGANGIVDYVNDYIFDGDYILIAEDGGHFFDFWEYPIAIKATGKFWVNNHAHILKANKINSDFLFYSLVHKDIMKYVNGSTRSKLTQEDMNNLIIDLPQFEREQEEIVVIFSTVDEEINCLQNEIKQLKEQKIGLMQLLLTGIVRVEAN